MDNQSQNRQVDDRPTSMRTTVSDLKINLSRTEYYYGQSDRIYLTKINKSSIVNKQ